MCSGGKPLRKTSLQSAFGDFGHIVQIETPKSNLAFVAFDDAADAKDAMRAMDGKNIDGQAVSVTKAGPKPIYRPEAGEPKPQVLMTTQTEREEVARRTASWEDQKGAPRDRNRDRERSRRSPAARSPPGRGARSRGGRRSPAKRSPARRSPARRSPAKRRSRSR